MAVIKVQQKDGSYVYITPNGKNASEIKLTDTDGIYNSDNVEGALVEVNKKLKGKASQTDLETERARITNLATLKQGSTTGDAELIDARVGIDGSIYANAGTAIRTQFDSIMKLPKNLFPYAGYEYSYVTGDVWKFKDFDVTANIEEGKEYAIKFGIIENHPTIMQRVGSIVALAEDGTTRLYEQPLPVQKDTWTTFKVVNGSKDGKVIKKIVVRIQVLVGDVATENATAKYGNIVIHEVVNNVIDNTVKLNDGIYIKDVEELKRDFDKLADAKPTWITKKADSLNNETLTVDGNNISINKRMVFSANIGSQLGSILVGHGKTNYGGNYLEITATSLVCWRYDTSAKKEKEVNHNLTISDYITVIIETNKSQSATIKLITSSGIYELNGVYWAGNNGNVFVESVNSDLTNCKVSWSCADYDKEIHIYGDSYCGVTGDARFPYYLIKWGYTDFLLDAFPGKGVEAALNTLKLSLEHCTPKYIVWTLGMNNPDSETAINDVWLSSTQEMLKICEEKGITPILATIPNTIGGAVDDTDIASLRIHKSKNAWIKNSGHRYIDFCSAVGADNNYHWYEGMLSGDNVHPSTSGALALAARFVQDFPEITITK